MGANGVDKTARDWSQKVHEVFQLLGKLQFEIVSQVILKNSSYGLQDKMSELGKF